MKFWQLIAKDSLKQSFQAAKPLSERELLVKVNKVLLTPSDLLVYDEKLPLSYPILPGSYAVGTVCEGYGVDPEGDKKESSGKFYRGEKVALRTYSETEDGLPVISGVHKNGYLSDFTHLTQEKVFHIPSSVTEDEALFLGPVSLAEAAIEALDPDEGDFVLVSGENVLSLLLCQLLLYYKVVPVYVSSSQEKTALAKSLGVFYAFESGESAQENIFRITGGKLCDGAIYCHTMNRTAPSLVMNGVSFGAKVVFCGLGEKSWSVDSVLLTTKALTLKGVYSGQGHEHTAMGILAGHVLNFNKLLRRDADFSSLPEAYDFLSENASNYPVAIVKID